MALFKASPDNACDAFLNTKAADNNYAKAAREHCESLWLEFEDCADQHFLSEFPVHFHERWFEMYLTVMLRRLGFDVQCPKPGPDVLVTVGDQQIWIEATCPSSGEPGMPDSVPDPVYADQGEAPVARRVPIREMVLRIRNALDSKEKKFREWIDAGIVGKDDITVVAINVRNIPFAWVDIDELMRRSYYGLGDLQITVDRDTFKTVDQGYQHMPIIKKEKTGGEVGVQPFVDGSLGHISAALGSWEDVANLSPYLGGGFLMYPNLTADVSWPTGAFAFGQEWISDSKGAEEWALTKHNYLPD